MPIEKSTRCVFKKYKKDYYVARLMGQQDSLICLLRLHVKANSRSVKAESLQLACRHYVVCWNSLSVWDSGNYLSKLISDPTHEGHLVIVNRCCLMRPTIDQQKSEQKAYV